MFIRSARAKYGALGTKRSKPPWTEPGRQNPCMVVADESFWLWKYVCCFKYITFSCMVQPARPNLRYNSKHLCFNSFKLGEVERAAQGEHCYYRDGHQLNNKFRRSRHRSSGVWPRDQRLHLLARCHTWPGRTVAQCDYKGREKILLRGRKWWKENKSHV